MAGVGDRGGLRKSHLPSSARDSETQSQGVQDSMVPRDPCYELAGHRVQSLGDKENVALGKGRWVHWDPDLARTQAGATNGKKA